MALHPAACEICDRLRQIERGEHPGFLAELPSGFVVLGDSQFFEGYTLLLCRYPAPDLEDLNPEHRLQFLTDLALVSEAVSRVVKPHKMNLESLGNVVPHLHFHLFPRRLSDPAPLAPVWGQMPSPEDELRFAFSLEKHGELKEKLRAALVELGAK